MYSLLYVDDEHCLLEIGKLFLEETGDFLVTTIGSATTALELLQAERFDAIISDYQMPEMDGIMFLRHLKASGNTTPFIIFTGKGREEVAIEAYNVGATFYIQKGGDPSAQFAELSHKIRSAISHQRAEKHARDTEKRLYDIINFLPDATFAIDKEGKVIAWNRAIEEMTGVPGDEMLGKGDYEYSIPFYGVRRPILIDLVTFSDVQLSGDSYAIIKREGDILIAETTLPRPMGKSSILLGKASILYNDEGEVIGAIESIRDITEQKQAEKELRKARDEYVELLEHMNDVFYRSDTQGRLILASRSWAEDLGFDDLSECLGKNIADTFYANPADRKRFVEEVYRHGSVSDYEVTLKKKDGTIVPVATSSFLYFDDAGKVLGIEGTWRDITERKHAEAAMLRVNERLSRQTRILSILNRVIDTANTATDLRQFLSEVLDKILELLDYDAGGIYLTDHTTGIARIACSNNIPPGIISEIGSVSINVPPYDSLFMKGIPLFTNTYDTVSPEHFAMTGFNSLASVPLVSKNMITGALNVASKERHEISKDEQKMLVSIGRELGNIIYRISAEEESKKAAKALEENELLLRSIINVAPVGIGVAVNRVIRTVNDQFCQITGYTAEELIGKPARLLYPAQEDYDYVGREEYDQVTSKGHGSVETRFRRKDGKIIDVLLNSAPIDPSDLSVGVTFTALDITEQVMAGKKLQDSENRYRLINDASLDFIYSYDRDGRFTSVNRALCEALHMGPGEIIGMTHAELGFPDVTCREWEVLHQKVYDTGRTVTAPTSTPMPDGTVHHYEVILNPIRDPSGVIIGISGTTRDITERRRAEEALRESEVRYRHIFESLEDLYYQTDTNGIITVLSPSVYRLSGWKPEDLIGKPVTDIYINSQDRVDLLGTIAKQGYVRDYELELLRKDGTLIAVSLSAGRIYHADGSPAGLAGTLRDISERKQSEMKLKESEANFRTFFETIGDMVVVVTPDGRILFTNNALSQKSGYTTEELLMMQIGDLHPPEKRQEAENIFFAMFRGERDSCPLPVASKSGVTIPVETRVWFGRWNGVYCLFGILKDLSTEEEAKQRFESLFRHNPAHMALSVLPGGTFIDVNDTFLDALGYERDEIIGKTAEEIGLFPDMEHSKAMADQLLAEGHVSNFEIQVRCKNGTVLDGIFSGDRISSHGKQYFLTVLIDITERKHLEHELLVHENELIRYSTELARDVAERKRVETLLLEKSEELERYFTSSLDLLCITDTKGSFIRVNPEWERVLGYTVKELEGRESLDFVHPDDREKTIQVISTLAGQDEITSFENRYRTKDGTYRWIEWRSRPHGDTIYSVARDITKRKLEEEELRVTADRLKLATRAGSVGIWDWDVVNNRLVWDQQMFNLYGITPGQSSGTYDTWQAVLHPDDREPAESEIMMALKGEKEFNTEFRVVWPGGEVHYIRALANVQRDDSGRPVHMIGTNWDITDRKQAEEALRRANRQLSLLNSITRHDINNKLTIILGYLNIAGKKSTNPVMKDYLGKITSAAEIIQSQIAFTRVYQDLGTREPKWQQLDRVLPRNNVPATINLVADIKGVEIFADLMLEKVFFNLLDNSIRHGEHVTEIRVSSITSDQGLKIIWEDNGAGIPYDEKEKIFERGFGRNTGLGMFLVREILLLTGITMKESGEPGKGARFEILVPKGAYRTGLSA